MSVYRAPPVMIFLLLFLYVFLNWGCGSTCQQLTDQRDAIRLRQVERVTREPHVIATIPLAIANELIEPQVRELEPLRLQIPGAGLLGPYLTNLKLCPRDVRLTPAEGPGVGIEVVLDVRQGDATFFSMTVRGAIQPNLDVEGRRVEVVLNATDFSQMDPELDETAALRLAESLYDRLPRIARMVLSPRDIATGAAVVTEVILSQSYPMIRDSLLAGLGPIARVELRLPNLPIERVDFSTVSGSGTRESRGHLRLGITTPLAIDRGVEYASEERGDGREISLRMSGSAVAMLANWAMDQGQLPRRFSERGQPDEDGAYEAYLEWAEGERPLRIQVFRLEGRCLRALLTALPHLRLEGEDVVLEVEDVRVDELEGPPLPGFARLFARIWVRAMRRTQTMAGTLELSIGGRAMVAQVTAVARDDDEVRMSLSLTD